MFLTGVLIPCLVLAVFGWLAIDGVREQLDRIEDVLELLLEERVDELVDEEAGEFAVQLRAEAGMYDWQADERMVAR